MSEILIVGIVKERGRIIAFVIDEGTYDKDEVINHIVRKDEGWEHVYTFVEGYAKARVFVKTLYTGTRFLCTPPDGVVENNIGSLPQY